MQKIYDMDLIKMMINLGLKLCMFMITNRHMLRKINVHKGGL